MNILLISMKQVLKKTLILLCFLMIVVAMAMLATTIVEDMLLGDEFKLKVVLVNEDDSDEMEFISKVVLSSDEITDKFEIIEEDDREQATAMIEENEVVAGIIFPEGFINSVMIGTNYSPVILMNDSIGLEQSFMESMIVLLEDVMRSTQSGIYTVLDGVKTVNGQDSDIVYDVNYEYIMYLLNRDRIFDVEEVEYVETVSLYEHYAITLSIYLLFLSTAIFYREMSLKTDGKVRKQVSTMSRVGYQMFWSKIGIMVALYLLLLLVISSVLGGEITPYFMINLLVGASLLILYQVWMFHITRSFTTSVLINFILHTIFLFVVGGVVPDVFLPDYFEVMVYFTPTYYLQTLCFSGFTARNEAANILYITICISIMLAFLLQWKMKKILKET